MPRRSPKTRHDWKRGRHKKDASEEVVDWNARVACPEQPSWMDRETWEKLRDLRKTVDHLQ